MKSDLQEVTPLPPLGELLDLKGCGPWARPLKAALSLRLIKSALHTFVWAAQPLVAGKDLDLRPSHFQVGCRQPPSPALWEGR